MRTKVAKYEDMPRVVKYLRKMHKTTGWDRLPFDEDTVKKNVVTMIRTQDIADVLIAEHKGEIRGVLLAVTDTFFWNKAKYASDMHFVADGGGAALLPAFTRWADERNCSCLVMAVATDDERAERLYEKVGFKRVGGTMVFWFTAEQEKAA